MSDAAAENRPFAIQLEVEFLDRLNEPVRDGKAKSVSEIIRAALARFDLDKVVVMRPSQLLISVRLPGEIREKLTRVAKEKHTSVGVLVRSAVEAYLPQLESGAVDQLEMAIPTEEPAPASSGSESSESPADAAAAKPKRSRSKPARGRKKPVAPAKPAPKRPVVARPKPTKPAAASRKRAAAPAKPVPRRRRR